MDTFIDKLAQKRNAQEMIRANSAAEAAKMDQMQKQLQAYDEIMQEIRRVNIKTAENVENMRGLLAQCVDMLGHIKTEDGQSKDMEQQLEAVRGLMEQQLEAVRGLMERQLEEVRGSLEERHAQTQDFVHKENVKVYRNVQAAFTEELEKQSRMEEENRAAKGGKMSSPLLVAVLIGVIVDIAVNLIPLVLQLTNVKLF